MQMLVSGTGSSRLTTVPASYATHRNPVTTYLGGLAPSSRRTMRGALDTMAHELTAGTLGADEMPWHLLRYQYTKLLRQRLAERYSPAGANLHLAALRGVLREAWRLHYMKAETYRRAIDLERVRGERLPRGRALDAGELRAIFESCEADKSPAGARDAALFAVLYGAGLRRAEAVALDAADFDPDSGALHIRHGKGNKERIAYATNGAQKALVSWLSARGSEPGPLFCPVSQTGVVRIGPLTTQAVYNIAGKRATRAGVDHFSPHDLRRTFVSDLLDAGADVAVVAKLAGHANVTTTTRYDRRPETAKRRAAELLHVPFVAWSGASALARAD